MYFAQYDFYEINKHKLRVCFFDTTVLIMNSILIINFIWINTFSISENANNLVQSVVYKLVSVGLSATLSAIALSVTG